MDAITVAGKDAWAELDRLRSAYPKAGLYPILFDDEDAIE
jgi:hypothetical protein